jgi:uncharacterized HAD superfamily protein
MSKIVSIDFDGVLIEKVFGVDWKSQGKSRVMKNNLWLKVYRYIDKTWAFINHNWRTPIPGSKEGLQKLKDKGYKLVFITSRQGYLRDITTWWLRKWGYFQFFNELYFNDKLIGSMQSKSDNIKLVRPGIHIDDNRETVLKLADECPWLKIYFLNRQKNRKMPGNVVRVEKWGEIEI